MSIIARKKNTDRVHELVIIETKKKLIDKNYLLFSDQVLAQGQ